VRGKKTVAPQDGLPLKWGEIDKAFEHHPKKRGHGKNVQGVTSFSWVVAITGETLGGEHYEAISTEDQTINLKALT